MTTVQSANMLNVTNSVNKVVDTAEAVINNVDETLTNTIAIIVTFIVKQSSKLLKFLVDKNVVSAGIAIIVGTQIGKITGAFVDNLLGPFINLIIPSDTKHLEEYEIELYGAHFKVGLFISNLIQFLLNMSMVYYVFQITQISSGNFDMFLNQSIAVGTMSSQ